jgi:hypothetical protein
MGPGFSFLSVVKERRHRHERCRGPEPFFVMRFPKQQVYQIDQVDQVDQVEQVDQGALVCSLFVIFVTV